MGMTPKVFTPNGATRIEHFDTIDAKLRPFRTLIASTVDSTTPAVAKLMNMEKYNNEIYAVGVDYTTPTYLALYKWSTSTFSWLNMYSSASTGTTSNPNAMLQSHSSYLFGLRANRYIYRYDPAGNTYSMSFYDATSVTYFSDPITHSKDGICYIPLDNRIVKIDSTGATATLAITLPNANYRITSICEQGNFVNICGYDLKSGVSSSLLWDRDTSVVDLTESYEMGNDRVYHNASLQGTTFFICLREDVLNSSFTEKPVLAIKYINSGNVQTLTEFPVSSFNVSSGYIGSKYQSDERLYFACLIKFDGESAARNIAFCLNGKGKLTIAQNASVDAGTALITGLLRDGEAFWLGAGVDGAWNTTSTYTTIAAFETTDIRAEDLSKNLQLMNAYVMSEPLPASAQILLKARKNEETTFTTIKTITGTSKMRHKLTGDVAVSALNGLDKAKLVRFRLESTVGAVITGFQAIFNEVDDVGNG